MSETTETQDAINAGVALADPKPLDADGRFFSVVVPDGGSHRIVDLELHFDNYREFPRRKTGQFAAHTVEAFIAYLTKHAMPCSEVWADLTSSTVTAVINAHQGQIFAGHGDHRVILQMQKTPAWKAWIELDGKWQTQAQFAEFIEDHSADIADPPAATLMEITRSFKATKKVEFEQGNHLSTGEVQLVYRETVDAKAGKKGEVSIPESITLGLAPYEGGQRYQVPARLRFVIDEGQLRLKFVLDRPREIERGAFDHAVDIIRAGVEAPVFHGRSA